MKVLTIFAVVVFAAWMYLGIQLVDRLETDGIGIIERVSPTTGAEESGDEVQGAGGEYGPGGGSLPTAEDEDAAVDTQQVEQNSSSETNPPDEKENPPMIDEVNIIRELPPTVTPGEIFDVIVTFTLSDDNSNSVGLTDVAPAGWNVSLDITWCTPPANFANTPDTGTSEYIWFGPYDAGQTLTATYKVQVPSNATSGAYTFGDGWLKYYLGTEGPYKADITGDAEVTVANE